MTVFTPIKPQKELICPKAPKNKCPRGRAFVDAIDIGEVEVRRGPVARRLDFRNEMFTDPIAHVFVRDRL